MSESSSAFGLFCKEVRVPWLSTFVDKLPGSE